MEYNFLVINLQAALAPDAVMPETLASEAAVPSLDLTSQCPLFKNVFGGVIYTAPALYEVEPIVTPETLKSEAATPPEVLTLGTSTSERPMPETTLPQGPVVTSAVTIDQVRSALGSFYYYGLPILTILSFIGVVVLLFRQLFY